MFCARCKDEIAPGDKVVRCPTCFVLHHQKQGLNCWTYDKACAVCDQPTALEGACYRWTPETL
jgi:hypothetical protein